MGRLYSDPIIRLKTMHSLFLASYPINGQGYTSLNLSFDHYKRKTGGNGWAVDFFCSEMK